MQGEHWDTSDSLIELPNVPAGHFGVEAVVPVGQYDPRGQSKYLSVVAPSQKYDSKQS